MQTTKKKTMAEWEFFLYNSHHDVKYFSLKNNNEKIEFPVGEN